MKKLFKYLPLCLIFAVSCNEAELPEYQNEPGLYFYRSSDIGGINNQRDSTSFMFFAKRKAVGEEYLQEIDIRTVGFPENRERRFTLTQSNAGAANAAVAGVHYVSFDDPRMAAYLTIPANATSCVFPVICINHASLAERRVRLEIKITDNENFVQGIQAQSTFVVNFSDIAERPISWTDGQATMNWWPWLGDWSAVKMRFIIMHLDFVDFDEEYNRIKSDSFLMDYYARKLYRLLREYNEAHPGDPLTDENGRRVQFPERWAN